MKTISRIKKFIDNELAKLNDRDLSESGRGKEIICRHIGRIIDDHEPEPPTLRPMSELPATKSTYITFCNFLAESNSGNRYYMNGHYFKSEAAGTYACIGDDTPEPLQGWVFGKYKLIGWLPLPNPNEIL